MVLFVGCIVVGVLIIVDQQIDEIFFLLCQLVGKGDLFMLKVVGELMIDVVICDGDWVVVCQQNSVENGEIVVVMFEGEVIVKVFCQCDGYIWLLFCNFFFELIMGDWVEVFGKVVVVFCSV